MGVALNVFRLIPQHGRDIIRDLTSLRQLRLDDHEIGHGLPTPRSDLYLQHYDKETRKALFTAVHHSTTIKQEIRISAKEIIDGIEEPQVTIEPVDVIQHPVRNSGTAVRREYQEIHRFQVLIDLALNEVLVFAKKTTARDFMRRFKQSGKIDYAPIYLDLSRIDEVPDLANVFGVWMDGRGNVKKRALYGTEVHRETGVELVTSYEVIVDDGDETLNFFIGHDCRISSRMNNLTNTDLIERWDAFKVALGVTETPTQTA